MRELDRRGIRRNWMAARLGVRPWTFSRIEGGTLLRPSDWYQRAATVLGVRVKDIEAEDGEFEAA